IAAMLATLGGRPQGPRREGGVEPRQPGLRSPRRHRDFASREMDGHESNALSTPVWNTGVYRSTPMLDGIPCWGRTSLFGFGNRRLALLGQRDRKSLLKDEIQIHVHNDRILEIRFLDLFDHFLHS